MAKYTINLRTESHIAGATHVEMATLTDLRVEMAKFVGEVLKDHAALIWVDEEWKVEAADAQGLILYSMYVSAFRSAATSA
jgi:hypothetical protein